MASLSRDVLLGQYQLAQGGLAQPVHGTVVFNLDLLGARKDGVAWLGRRGMLPAAGVATDGAVAAGPTGVTDWTRRDVSGCLTIGSTHQCPMVVQRQTNGPLQEHRLLLRVPARHTVGRAQQQPVSMQWERPARHGAGILELRDNG